jgi:hypothetical protein
MLSPDVCRRVAALHARIGSPAAGERANALEKLDKLLAEHGCTWNDLQEILAANRATTTNTTTTNTTTTGGSAASPQGDASVEAEVAEAEARGLNLFDILVVMCERYVWVRSAHERTAIVLSLLNAWVFDRFEHCPRLVVLAPTSGHGKSRLLKKFIRLLLREYFYSGNASAASIYGYLEDNPYSPIIVDEADNLKIEGVLLSLFNEGHEYGGSIDRHKKKYNVFVPLFIGGIGTALPRPLMHRAAVMHMQKRPPGVKIEPLKLIDPPREFAVVREMIRRWAATCSLNDEPAMPPELGDDRTMDNWRPWISIADCLGRGEAARAAAIALSQQRIDEDPITQLVTDTRTVFNTLPLSRWGANRATVDGLNEMLVGLEHGYWAEWRGKNGNDEPRKLRRTELVKMLGDLHPPIRSKMIWPRQRRQGDRSQRGYERHQFEEAWATYCPVDDTPPQPSKIIHLPRK